jgi:hypothetical protein
VRNLGQPEPFNEAVREVLPRSLGAFTLSRWPAVSAAHPRGQRLLFHARGVVSLKSKTLETDEGQASAGALPALTALLHR